MNPFAAKAYRNVDLDSSVMSADPHRLILMLFDGALETVRLAEGHIAAGRSEDRARAVTKALKIVGEGLRGGLNRKDGGTLAERLGRLYDYITMRLLQANLRGDVKALHEVARLLGTLRDAWVQITPGSSTSTSVKASLELVSRAEASAAKARAPVPFVEQLMRQRLALQA